MGVSTVPYQFGQLEHPPGMLIVSSKTAFAAGRTLFTRQKALNDNVGELPLH
jgi:hypothetical protein